MIFIENLLRGFNHPVLSRKRICVAMVVALTTDALQFGLGPFGWVFVDEGLDVLAMILISRVIGFHMLLLPTFVIELIPGPDMLPTWTGCTVAVILLRRKNQPHPDIDVHTEVTRVPPVQLNVPNGGSKTSAAAAPSNNA